MEIAPGVHSLGQRRGGHVHAFLLDDGHGLTVIDTLFDTDGGRILSAINRLGHTPSDLKQIVLTHGHRSHLGALAAPKRRTGATVYAHEWEADIIAGERKAQPVTWRVVRPVRTWWPNYPFQLGVNLGFGKHPGCPIDRAAADGDAIGPLQVIHAPGHSPGHLAFYWPERRALFAGDAIVTWPTLAAGWPNFTLNATQHGVSLRRLAGLDVSTVGVGHGEPIVRDAGERLQWLAHEV
jgi:glyoxylase-like metal-dependent hydrolase (beta-lactamase superfamily II)